MYPQSPQAATWAEVPRRSRTWVAVAIAVPYPTSRSGAASSFAGSSAPMISSMNI
jgi:hypothetical protein